MESLALCIFAIGYLVAAYAQALRYWPGPSQLPTYPEVLLEGSVQVTQVIVKQLQ